MATRTVDSVPHVDPRAKRGAARRVIDRLIATPAMLWFEHSAPWRIIGWRLMPRLMRMTGRLAVASGVPTGVIETTDARNGRPHRRCALYFHDGDRVIVVPSKAGLPGGPHWYLNALAQPNVTFGGAPFRAEDVSDADELTRLWTLADGFYPGYALYRAYAARDGRTVPILRLVPR
jgi:deazaflavin-dependent oxidoreductase (nitroreductase family)